MRYLADKELMEMIVLADKEFMEIRFWQKIRTSLHWFVWANSADPDQTAPRGAV